MTTTALAVNVSADNHDEGGDPGDDPGEMTEEEYHAYFNSTDTDDDGNVSWDEFEAANCPDGCDNETAEHLAVMFALADADGSGGVSWDEFWTFFGESDGEGELSPSVLMALWDADGSGNLTLQEVIDGMNGFRTDDGEAAMDENEEALFASFFSDADEDEDGALDIDELTTFWDDVMSLAGPSPEELMDAMDLDGDEKLSYQEVIDAINAQNEAEGEPVLSDEQKQSIQQVFDESDLNVDSYIDLDEFEDFWDAIGYGGDDDGPAPEIIFDFWDANKDNFLTSQEIINAINADNEDEGEPALGADEEAMIEGVFDDADENEDGMLNLQEFEAFMDILDDLDDDGDDGCPFDDDDFCMDISDICDDESGGYDPAACGEEAAHYCADGEEDGDVDPGCDTFTEACDAGDMPVDMCDAFVGFDHDNHHDSDGDGVANEDDLCEGNDDSVDDDGDGVPDGCDQLVDSDGDGVANEDDQCAGNDDSIDADGDGVPDACDSDDDDDGVADDVDDFPNDNCAALDTDGDGEPDNVLDGEFDAFPDCQTDLNEDDDDDDDGVWDAIDCDSLDPTNNRSSADDHDNDGVADDGCSEQMSASTLVCPQPYALYWVNPLADNGGYWACGEYASDRVPLDAACPSPSVAGMGWDDAGLSTPVCITLGGDNMPEPLEHSLWFNSLPDDDGDGIPNIYDDSDASTSDNEDDSDKSGGEDDDDDDDGGGGLPGFTLGLTMTAMMGALLLAGRRKV